MLLMLLPFNKKIHKNKMMKLKTDEYAIVKRF